MGIPPDPYPTGQAGITYAGTTGFDPQTGGAHVRYAEIRGGAGEDVVSLSITVIPPPGRPTVPLAHVSFGLVNTNQPQIVVGIQSTDGSAVVDGYICQFEFHTLARRPEAK